MSFVPPPSPFRCSGSAGTRKVGKKRERCPRWLPGFAVFCPTCKKEYGSGIKIVEGSIKPEHVVTPKDVLHMLAFFSGECLRGQRTGARRAKVWGDDLGAEARLKRPTSRTKRRALA